MRARLGVLKEGTNPIQQKIQHKLFEMSCTSTWRLRGSDVDSTPQCIPYILSALPYVPGSPTIHQHDPRRHYLICGRQSIGRQT